MVKYVYDAWGNHKVLDASGNAITSLWHIGHLNPFRYRGYYYDTETGLYYLKSRYYDPVACRFISADDLAYVDPDHVNGTNLYAYCNNNPVMNVDSNGRIPVVNIGPVRRIPFENMQLGFSVGVITPKNYDMPSWLSLNFLYAKGSAGLAYSKGEGLTVLSFSAGLIDFSATVSNCLGLPDDHWTNDFYFGAGAWNVNASLGFGFSASIEIVSIYGGWKVDDNLSIEAKVFGGFGAALDFSEGVRFQFAFIVGVEISFKFDWNRIRIKWR